MAVNKPSNASCRDVADEGDDNATPRSPRVDGLNKGALDLPLVISGVGCDTEGAEVLEHDASSTPATTTIFRRFGSVDHRKWEAPSAWRPFYPTSHRANTNCYHTLPSQAA